MAGFTFRLEQVLIYRKQVLDQAQLRFAEAMTAYEKQKAVRQAVQSALQDAMGKLASPAGLAQGEFWLLCQYAGILQHERKAAFALEQEYEKLVEQCRVILLEKAREHELLVKLKGKMAKRHAQEEQMFEQRMYDEIATLRKQPQTF